MISSEVQRTLVKSPPELWTELSDPDALARHLGELGEIKITRTQPEELIEWEAEGTTGTVAIKPSGWGTKVTLTVTRELPPAGDTMSAEASKPEAGEDADSASAAAIAGDEPDSSPAEAPSGASPPSADPQALGETEAQEKRTLAEEPLATGTETEPQEPKPAPATEAARRAAGRPSWGTAGGPAIESDLRSAEASEPSEAGGLAEWHAGLEPSARPETAPERSGEPEPKALTATPQPEPRRGFFARLFGGKRRRAPVTVLAEQEPLADKPPQPAEETSDPDAVPATEPVDALEDELATEPVAMLEDELATEPVTALEDDDATEPAAAASDVSEAIDAEEAAAQTDSTVTAAETTSSDLAAELRAAEETAAEEVKALLTGVLDRLGAAHHRPFSRS